MRRRVLPVGIMFSEYYFYLTAFLEDKTDFDNPDDLFPTIYRIDRIQDFRVLEEHFRVPYCERVVPGTKGKTCRQVGAHEQEKEKRRTETATREYSRI